MTIRWRLLIVALQLGVLALVTHQVTGSIVTGETWFIAGLLAVVVNPQLLEPWYPAPGDSLANSLIGGTLYAASSPNVTEQGWRYLLLFLAIVAISSVMALGLGANREAGFKARVGRASTRIARLGNAAVIYSAIFWLSALENYSLGSVTLWQLGASWGVIIAIGSVDWSKIWGDLLSEKDSVRPLSIVGPSTLEVEGDLPASGTEIKLSASNGESKGVVVTRIHRTEATWASVCVYSHDDIDSLVNADDLSLQIVNDDNDESRKEFIGAVGKGSSVDELKFVATREARVGDAVWAEVGDRTRVLYQISEAAVQESRVSGGAHLTVRAKATQIGRYDNEDKELLSRDWIPPVGQPVYLAQEEELVGEVERPDGAFEVGTVTGTDVPVFLNLSELRSGHMAVLGMTRMGKTSFAVQVAETLANNGQVRILDQTGEYTGRRELERWTKEAQEEDGLAVLELEANPDKDQSLADRAYGYLTHVAERARKEYLDGAPGRRALLIDEAHQFVPEPAVLGFGTPGRESAVRFGLLMMQVRKYGICIILVSQRTAVVAKSALSQCENIVAFRTVDATGLDYLEEIIGSASRELLPKLDQGQAIVSGPAFSVEDSVAIDVHHPEQVGDGG